MQRLVERNAHKSSNSRLRTVAHPFWVYNTLVLVPEQWVWWIPFKNQIQRCFGHLCAKNRQNVMYIIYLIIYIFTVDEV